MRSQRTCELHTKRWFGWLYQKPTDFRSDFCFRSDFARCNPLKRWGGRWESNPQRPEPQSGALPVELLPPHLLIITSALQVRLEREVFGLQIQRMGNVDFRIKEQISDSRFHISLRKRGQLKMCSLQSS